LPHRQIDGEPFRQRFGQQRFRIGHISRRVGIGSPHRLPVIALIGVGRIEVQRAEQDLEKLGATEQSVELKPLVALRQERHAEAGVTTCGLQEGGDAIDSAIGLLKARRVPRGASGELNAAQNATRAGAFVEPISLCTNGSLPLSVRTPRNDMVWAPVRTC
jgi:hypothetical protein